MSKRMEEFLASLTEAEVSQLRRLMSRRGLDRKPGKLRSGRPVCESCDREVPTPSPGTMTRLHGVVFQGGIYAGLSPDGMPVGGVTGCSDPGVVHVLCRSCFERHLGWRPHPGVAYHPRPLTAETEGIHLPDRPFYRRLSASGRRLRMAYLKPVMYAVQFEHPEWKAMQSPGALSSLRERLRKLGCVRDVQEDGLEHFLVFIEPADLGSIAEVEAEIGKFLAKLRNASEDGSQLRLLPGDTCVCGRRLPWHIVEIADGGFRHHCSCDRLFRAEEQSLVFEKFEHNPIAAHDRHWANVKTTP